MFAIDDISKWEHRMSGQARWLSKVWGPESNPWNSHEKKQEHSPLSCRLTCLMWAGMPAEPLSWAPVLLPPDKPEYRTSTNFEFQINSKCSFKVSMSHIAVFYLLRRETELRRVTSFPSLGSAERRSQVDQCIIHYFVMNSSPAKVGQDLSASRVLFVTCLLTGLFPSNLQAGICLRSLPNLSNSPLCVKGQVSAKWYARHTGRLAGRRWRK